jgi:uncharacterized protein with NRDE domain
MCLITFAWRTLPESPLVFIGNRDEFHRRPSAPAHWWENPAGILAGRDLQANGTWLGLNRQGRFAVVTNFREGDYAGFNLIFYDGETLGYFSNRGMHRRSLEPGLYALSNNFLDTPWPKVTRLKQALNNQLKLRWSDEAMLELMHDRQAAAEEDLPDTGIGKQWERMLSPAFIVSEEYGTRCTSLIRQDQHGRFSFTERSFDRDGLPSTTRQFNFLPEQDS